MLRVGAQTEGMRPLSSDDIFLVRLKLLIIMIKAFLKGFPLGDFRRTAFLDNAQNLFYCALFRKQAAAVGPEAESDRDQRERIFLQRVQLLAVMGKSCVESGTVDGCRRQAIADNLNYICEYLADQVQVSGMQFLKVA